MYLKLFLGEMKIILLQDVKKIGKAGDVVNVADGYARNFLLPKNIAEPATEEKIKEVEKRKANTEREAKERVEKAKKIKERMDGVEVVIKEKGENGKLFGSVDAKKIADKISEEGIKEDNIILDKPLKEVGEKEVKIKLDGDVEVKIKVVIELEK